MIDDIAHKNIIRSIDSQAVWRTKLPLNGRAIIASETRFPRTRNRADDSRFGIHLSHHMVADFYKEEIARFIPSDFIRLVKRCSSCGATIACIALLGTSCNRRNNPILGNLANSMIINITNVKGAIGATGNMKRIVKLSLGSRSTITRKSFDPSACKSFNITSISNAGKQKQTGEYRNNSIHNTNSQGH